MRLDHLFIVKNGIVSTQVTVHARNPGDFIPYIRPSSTQIRTIGGWLDPNEVKPEWIHPKETIIVSTNGEGSHTYAYVSDFDFVVSNNAAVLIPKKSLTLKQKIFYARCITMNRYKFSYGRGPRGRRLQIVELPDQFPEWLNEVKPVYLTSTTRACVAKAHAQKIGTEVSLLNELFEVKYGTSLELNRMTRDSAGINFVARTSKNNGVSAKVARVHDVEPIQGGVLTVAASGSVLETFYQEQPFYSGRDLYYLKPKTAMSRAQLLFYATCIRANQWKYSYGRQANRTLKALPIPALDSIPDWVDSLYKTEFKLVQTVDSKDDE